MPKNPYQIFGIGQNGDVFHYTIYEASMCRSRRVNAIKNSFCELNSVAVESERSKMEAVHIFENGKTHNDAGETRK